MYMHICTTTNNDTTTTNNNNDNDNDNADSHNDIIHMQNILITTSSPSRRQVRGAPTIVANNVGS